MKRIIFATLASLSTLAPAQTIGLHTVSRHEHSGMNNTNPGLYYRADNGFTAGFYRNSYREQSAYLAWTFETDQWRGITAAVTVGGVSGYPAAKVMALVVPNVAYHVGESAVRIGIVPKPPSHGTAASLHLMLEHHF